MYFSLYYNYFPMSLLQINIDNTLKKAIKAKASLYGVPASTLVRIVLVKTFLEHETQQGNVFNAERDNKGKGIPLNDFLAHI